MVKWNFQLSRTQKLEFEVQRKAFGRRRSCFDARLEVFTEPTPEERIRNQELFRRTEKSLQDQIERILGDG